MQKQRSFWFVILALLGLCVVSTTAFDAQLAHAAVAQQVATLNASQGRIVAHGLANPRGLVVRPDGTLYVAEAGLGGTEKITDPGFGPSIRGFTGRISKITPRGDRTTVTDHLPSTALGGFEATGPAGLTLVGGSLYVAVGLTNSGYTPRPEDASVVRVDVRSGARKTVANIGAYEFAHNPDGYSLESNPYGIAYGTDRQLYVADGGGNTLYRVNPRTKQLNLVTVFAGLPSTVPNPGRGGKKEADPVPTGVIAAPDGSVYVALFSGVPFAPGTSKVVRVTPDGKVSDVVKNLTLAIGMTIGPDGHLYISQYSSRLDPSTHGFTLNSGRVLRVLTNGTPQVVVDHLNLPNGIGFDACGNLYVNVNTDVPVAKGAQGQVLRFDGIARR